MPEANRCSVRMLRCLLQTTRRRCQCCKLSKGIAAPSQDEAESPRQAVVVYMSRPSQTRFPIPQRLRSEMSTIAVVPLGPTVARLQQLTERSETLTCGPYFTRM